MKTLTVKFSQFLFENSFQELKSDLNGLKNYQPKIYQDIDILSIEEVWFHNIDAKKLTANVQFEAEMKSFDKPNKAYQVVVNFLNVPILLLTKKDEESGKYDKQIKSGPYLKAEKTFKKRVGAQEEMYLYFRVPNEDDLVKIRCTCPNYRFVFQWSNKKVGSLAGQVDPYTRVPGSTRPPVNPEQKSGYCKHITNFVNILKRKGLFNGERLNVMYVSEEDLEKMKKKKKGKKEIKDNE